jgi:hypothetical protein
VRKPPIFNQLLVSCHVIVKKFQSHVCLQEKMMNFQKKNKKKKEKKKKEKQVVFLKRKRDKKKKKKNSENNALFNRQKTPSIAQKQWSTRFETLAFFLGLRTELSGGN